jgi:hypothetical protein
MSRPTNMEISSGLCGDFITETCRLGLRCPDRAARVAQETHSAPPAHPRPDVMPTAAAWADPQAVRPAAVALDIPSPRSL